MRIGVDARAAAEERGGRGTMVRELLRAWSEAGSGHTFELYARTPWTEPLADHMRWSLVGARDPLWHLAAARRANRRCDVFLSTNSYLTAWFLRVPSVVVVCDLVAWHREFAPQRRAAVIERATLPLAVRRAAALDCISESTARDLATHFPAARHRSTTIELAADARFSPEGSRARLDGRPYVLGVGTLEPRKNLPRLVEAFVSLPARVRGNRVLALAGPLGWQTGDTLAAIERHPDLIAPLGFVADDELPGLYRGADLFAYPSLYEGFGLPVLEAMSCGTPTLTSNVSSLPEVAGDAAVYVDPTDVQAIRDGLTRALSDTDLRTMLRDRGIQRAKQFSWSRAATETIALLERASGGRNAPGGDR
jgi:glycosyltransferase involved in cell wall biosynthesis